MFPGSLLRDQDFLTQATIGTLAQIGLVFGVIVAVVGLVALVRRIARVYPNGDPWL